VSSYKVGSKVSVSAGPYSGLSLLNPLKTPGSRSDTYGDLLEGTLNPVTAHCEPHRRTENVV